MPTKASSLLPFNGIANILYLHMNVRMYTCVGSRLLYYSLLAFTTHSLFMPLLIYFMKNMYVTKCYDVELFKPKPKMMASSL